MLKEKDSKWSINEVAIFNISSIKLDLSSFGSEWDLDLSRQQSFDTHKDTKMYRMRFSSYRWLIGDSIQCKDVNVLPTHESNKQLLDIYNKIEKIYDGKVVRAEFIKMPGNTKIPRHVDGGESLYIIRRLHIPIITNEKVIFKVFNNEMNLKEGICYEINNAMPHSVENNSADSRIHLIIDILPNKYNI
jgi:hypothetical protein